MQNCFLRINSKLLLKYHTRITALGRGCAIAALLLALLPNFATATQPPLPAPPNSDDLQKDFPNCPGDTPTLPSLRKCRGDLEAYRVGVLELYNVKIARYITALKQYDKTTELSVSRHQYSAEEYKNIHDQIVQALADAGPDGALLDVYHSLLSKYKETAKVVIADERDFQRLQ